VSQVSAGGAKTPLPASMDFEALLAQFGHQATGPPEVLVAGRKIESGATVEDLSFASPQSDRVPAWVVVPAGPGPHPAIVFLHSSNGSRDDFLTEAIRYAQRGAVGLTVTAAHARPGRRRFPTWTSQDREDVIQTVLDLRRALDVLLVRRDVDASRLAFVGLSYGADYGAVFCAVDGRLRACALISGGTLRDYYRRWAPGDVRDRYVELMETVAPDRYLPHVGRTALFLQNGAQDRTYTRNEISDFQASAPALKRVVMYESDHWLNEAATRERALWLGHELAIDRTTRD
jgi:dienelactone hydrolase